MNRVDRHHRPRVAWAVAWLIAMATAVDAAEYVDPVAYVRLRSPGHTGTVNALAFGPDGRELYSAGNDKSVRVWRNEGEPSDRWAPGTPMRWEVGYGETGRLYALDADAKTGLVAVGGRGGRGSSGEILLFDPERPKTYRSWRFPVDEAPPNVLQHDQVVSSIAFAPNGDWLASSDLNGQVLLWRGANRQPAGELLPPLRQINNRDRRIWEPLNDQPLWEADNYRPRRRPISWAGNELLVYPRLYEKDFYKTQNGDVPRWRVYAHDPLRGRSTELGDGSVLFPLYIVAIAATPDGRRIAVAGSNRCYLYERSEAGEYVARPLEAAYPDGEFIHAMAFTSDGSQLLIGRETPRGGRAELLTLDAAGAKQVQLLKETDRSVIACATTDQRLAFAAGSDVYIVELADPKPVLLAGGPRVEEVAFLASKDPSSMRLRVRSGADSLVVDPTQEETVKVWPNDEALPPLAEPGRQAIGWSFDPATLTVHKRRRVVTRIPLDPAGEGGVAASAWCWLKGPDGAPQALAVGTDLSGAILVYDLKIAGNRPKLLRKFVGHEGGVTTLAARPDGQMLASGSDDGSASLWAVSGLLKPMAEKDRLMSVWGVRLEPHERGGCRIVELATQGPFFNRGVRVGDRIARIKWRERGPLLEADDYEAIVAAIRPDANQNDIYADVVPTERAGDPFGLNFLPIWGPQISFYRSGQSWVAWTPTGHYDASIGGDRLIGWQFNKSLGTAPSFATAQQHHKTFRKPDLIRQLLGAKDEVVVKAIEQTLQEQTIDNDRLPEVRVVEEKPDDEGGVIVSVEVDVPAGETVKEVALIKAGDHKVDRITGPFEPGERIDLKFKPVDGSPQELSVWVNASTGYAYSKKPIRYQPDEKLKEKLEKLPDAKSVLYLLAVGVSQYQPSVDVAQLEFAHEDAKRVAEVFQRHRAYDRVKVCLLTTPEETTGQRVREELLWLRDVADGNDTIGLFFAGHSRIDANEVYLLPTDGDTRGLASSEIIKSCFDRSQASKVLILDSCNSGKFERAIKSKVRDSDEAHVGISFFAACAANQLAREDPVIGSGLFTSFIVKGLSGEAGRPGAPISDYDLRGYLLQDQDVRSRLRANKQEPVLVPSNSFTWLTRPGS